MSEASKQKLRVLRLGKKLTPEQRELRVKLLRQYPRTKRQTEQFWEMLRTRKKRTLTPEGRAKLSAAKKGKPITQRHLNQILDCAEKRKTPVICLTTGKWFESETAACEFIGVNRSKILTSIQRNGTCGKMKWAYANKL
jgi:hypothetical protein